MIQQSYFLAASYETKFFITSLVSTTLSLIYIFVFIYYDLNLNFVLGALVIFYCVKYFLSLYFILGEINFSFLAPLGVLIIFPVSLLTLKFNSFVIYAFSEILILFIAGYLIRKFYYQLKLGS
tara:strand:- start:151 stop:519 length:369 start_codon:yes stop_codon:yes gene_type:complete